MSARSDATYKGTDRKEDQAVGEGFDAARRGDPRSSCPYKNSGDDRWLREAWNFGYDREAKRKSSRNDGVQKLMDSLAECGSRLDALASSVDSAVSPRSDARDREAESRIKMTPSDEKRFADLKKKVDASQYYEKLTPAEFREWQHLCGMQGLAP